MDTRARFAVGGFVAGAASVAVISAVALTNSTALAVSEAKSVAPALVLSAAQTATPSLTPAPIEPVEEVQAEASVPEPPIVQAPLAAVPAAPEEPAVAEAHLAPAQTVVTPTLDEAVASGSWDAVRAWCQEHGWSIDKTEAWISRLLADRNGTGWREDSSESSSGQITLGSQQNPDNSGHNQSWGNKDHDNSHRQDAERSQDRSRDSPDRRDR